MDAVEVTTKGPEWAYGCYMCDYGVISEPDALTTYTSLYLRRAIGQHLELTNFCTCRAGLLSRQTARNNWTKYGNDIVLRQAKEILANPPEAKSLAE